MTAPLTGLSAIAGYQVHIDAHAQATPEQRMGDPADPRHAEGLVVAGNYPWLSKQTPTGTHGPYGPENQLLANPDEWLFFPAGDEYDDPTFDHTPARRAAPWPKGINSGPVPSANDPDQTARQLQISRGIHGVRWGAGLKSLTALDAQAGNWTEIWEVDPGHSDQVPIPKQLMSSGFMWGTTDRTQSMARQNEFGFDSAHKHRRFADAPIPGNYMWMRPQGRPMMKTLAGPARPAIGPTSPFAGQDLGQAFGIDGAILQNVPREYVPPPTPNLQAPVNSSLYADSNDALVEWY